MEFLRNKYLNMAMIPFLLAFTYFYPRFIIDLLGKENPWTSYLYMYGFGGVFFILGLFLILRSGACDLSRQHDRMWFKALIAGMVFFSCLHAFWIYLSLSIPVKGAL